LDHAQGKTYHAVPSPACHNEAANSVRLAAADRILSPAETLTKIKQSLAGGTSAYNVAGKLEAYAATLAMR
jgi:hypothetical protein